MLIYCICSGSKWTEGYDPFIMNDVSEEDIALAGSGYGPVNPSLVMVR